MKEVRCKCGALLCKAEVKVGSLEIKCKKCKRMTVVTKPYQDTLDLVKK